MPHDRYLAIADGCDFVVDAVARRSKFGSRVALDLPDARDEGTRQAAFSYAASSRCIEYTSGGSTQTRVVCHPLPRTRSSKPSSVHL